MPQQNATTKTLGKSIFSDSLVFFFFCFRFLVSSERESGSNFVSMFDGEEDIFL